MSVYNLNVETSEKVATNQIARGAGVVMLAFVLSNLTGLFRQILITQAFGTNVDIEAFNAANRVAETLFNLVAGGALASAFIPTFTGLLTKERQKDAWLLASAIGNLMMLILMALSVIAAIFAPQIVRYFLAPGFAGDFYKEALTVDLVRLMMGSAVIFGLSGLIMGILNSHQVFFIPALAPSMYQLGLIFGVLFLSPKLGIFGLAWGVLIGASLHLVFQLPSLVKLGGQYYPFLGLKLATVRDVGILMAPRLLGVAVVQINFWINTRLASQFVEGSVTGIVLAIALMLMPQAAIAQSIAIAAMPTFSAQVVLGKLSDLRLSLAKSLRAALLLSIPASIGMMILRKPIVMLLYQRGEFDSFSTELVAWALLWYAAGMVGHALVEILSRAFYSLHDTKTPVITGVFAMSVNVIFSYIFSALFIKFGWMAHGGLALANSLATALEAAGLVLLMRRRINGLEGMYIWRGTLIGLAAGSVMLFGLWFWQNMTMGWSVWFVALGGVFIGVLIYFLVALVLGLDEIKAGLRFIRLRLTR